jgi:hypothetical protein
MYQFKELDQLEEFLSNIANEKIKIKYLEGDHGALESYGLSLENSSGNKVIISGDTKANLEILNDIKESLNKNKKVKVLHDYSLWNSYKYNIHMCKFDYEELYLKELSKYKNFENNCEFILYHNNSVEKDVKDIEVILN